MPFSSLRASVPSLCGVLAACQPPPIDAPSAPGLEAEIPAPTTAAATAPALGGWTPDTLSPRPGSPSAEDAALLEACDSIDGGLMQVATRLAEHQAREMAMLGTDEVAFEMRSAGVPQVWPRAWSVTGDSSPEESRAGVAAWLASFDDGGERRCGVGRADSAIGRVVAVVALDAIADLEAIPRTARIGQWIDVRAYLLEPASDGKVVVLGPKGPPRNVSAALRGDALTSRVVVDQPGPWLIQVLASVEGGPRPVAESLVFVDARPPASFSAAPVPGDDVGTGSDPLEAIRAMLNAARSSEGLGSLKRHSELDVAAQIHAKAMQEARAVAHDVGMGGPAARVQALGLMPTILGENVARGGDLVLAHRALWASPSHRGNMLHARFTDVGIGLSQGEDGAVWVCQLYAAFQ